METPELRKGHCRGVRNQNETWSTNEIFNAPSFFLVNQRNALPATLGNTSEGERVHDYNAVRTKIPDTLSRRLDG